MNTGDKNQRNVGHFQPRMSRDRNLTFSLAPMDHDHKAHRPSQSGQKAEKKKGKEKAQTGFNEKVCVNLKLMRIYSHPLVRLLHQDQVEELISRLVAPLKEIRPVFMFHL